MNYFTKTQKRIEEAKAGQVFESSSGLTPDCAKFARTFKRELKAFCEGENLNLVSFTRGHFYLSAFVSRGNQMIYLTFNDLRAIGGSSGTMYVRRVQDAKDYTGGINKGVTVAELPGMICTELIPLFQEI